MRKRINYLPDTYFYSRCESEFGLQLTCSNNTQTMFCKILLNSLINISFIFGLFIFFFYNIILYNSHLSFKKSSYIASKPPKRQSLLSPCLFTSNRCWFSCCFTQQMISTFPFFWDSTQRLGYSKHSPLCFHETL